MRVFFTFFCSIVSQIAFANSSIDVKDLSLAASSLSTVHGYLFFKQAEDGNLGAETVDLLCSDGDIRLRVRKLEGIREFVSTSDFYCYAARALVKAANNSPKENVRLEINTESVDGRTEAVSATFYFGDSSSLDLYEVNASPLGKLGEDRLVER